MANSNTQAIQVIQELIGAAQQVMSIYDLLVTTDQKWTDQGVATILGSMKTSSVNPDGTIGQDDATPNSAHPLSLTAYPSLTRAISPTQITQIKSILDGLVSYVNGQSVTTQPGARAILNVAVGG